MSAECNNPQCDKAKLACTDYSVCAAFTGSYDQLSTESIGNLAERYLDELMDRCITRRSVHTSRVA